MSLDYLSQLSTDAKSLAAAVGHGPADAPIAGCPGWTLQQLGVHVGNVHRWARLAVMTGAPPQIDPSADPAPEDAAGLAGWIVEGAGRLIETLRGIDPTSPTWHPFPVEPKVSGLWPRRQAQETSVHRVDAEVAIGRPAYIDAAVAADGVDEYWHLMLPRMLTRDRRTPPTSVVAVELTDTGDRWVADGSSGSVVLTDAAPAAVLSGSAAEMLLRLWGRPVPGKAIAIEGDLAVAAQWLALGGS